MDDIVVTVRRVVDNVCIAYRRTCVAETFDELIECEHMTPGKVIEIKVEPI